MEALSRPRAVMEALSLLSADPNIALNTAPALGELVPAIHFSAELYIYIGGGAGMGGGPARATAQRVPTSAEARPRGPRAVVVALTPDPAEAI